MYEEITIKMSRKLWVDVLVDLDALEEELNAGLFDAVDELEPGSYQLIRELGYKGVEL